MKSIVPSAAMLVLAAASAAAQDGVRPGQFGVVEAPTAGATDVPLSQLPPAVLHTARVAMKELDGGAVPNSAQLDADEILAIYEIAGTANGRAVEADVRPDGVLVELEIEIDIADVPRRVLDAQTRLLPSFTPEGLVEKSIRPSEGGLPEIWYEFSGAEFDVEVRSDGAAALIEPA
jgi:hypothetical protein